MISDLRTNRLFCAVTLLLLLLNGCASKSPRLELPPNVAQQRITELNLAILGLGDDIDASEAQRAARIAIDYSWQLAREYEITDSAIVHNLKVNLGLKPRGLCVHWTRDLLARMQEEGFYSLDLHWAIANYENAFRLEHSTVVISARGDPLQQGLILDPWRHSGNLYWAPALQDPGYLWWPQAQIHALKREIEADDKQRN
jgi:hypothetical protein